MRVLFIILLLNSIVICQTIEEGWKGIKILKTNKTEVNNLLGKPEVYKDGHYGYKTDDAFIRISYSETPCKEASFGRGDYNIVEETVLNYNVNFKENIKLSEFKFKPEKYYRDTSGDLTNFVSYQNFEDGIIITVQIQESGKKDLEDVEYVRTINFTPSIIANNPYKCSSIIG